MRRGQLSGGRDAFIHSLIHSFTAYFLSTRRVPGEVSGGGSDHTEASPSLLCGSSILLAETEGKQNEQVKQLSVKVLRERYNFRQGEEGSHSASRGRASRQGSRCKGPGAGVSLGVCGDYRGMRKVERHRGPDQGGTGSLEGFMGTWVVQETLGALGREEACVVYMCIRFLQLSG